MTPITNEDKAVKRVELMLALLRVAKCPACDGSGAYYGGGGDEYTGPEVIQCQWCDERNSLINEGESKPQNDVGDQPLQENKQRV